MSDLHSLPDRPVFAFCLAYEPVGEPQPIRLVFASARTMSRPRSSRSPSTTPNASATGSMRARGSIAERGPHSSNDPDSERTTTFIERPASTSGGRGLMCSCRVHARLPGTTHPLRWNFCDSTIRVVTLKCPTEVCIKDVV